MADFLIFESQGSITDPTLPVVPPPPVPPTVPNAPLPIVQKRAVELPYYHTGEVSASHIAVMAVQPNADQTGAQVYVDGVRDTGIANPFVYQGSLHLFQGISQIDNEVIVVGDGITTDHVLLIDDEFMEVETITAGAQTTVTVKRGIWDTVPVEHHAGSRVWILTNFFLDSNRPPTSVLTVNVLSTTTTSVLPISLDHAISLALRSRTRRQLNVADVKVNGQYLPTQVGGDINVTYVSRNRFTQRSSATTLGFFDSTLMPPEDNKFVGVRVNGARTAVGFEFPQTPSGTITFSSEVLEATFESSSQLVDIEVVTFDSAFEVVSLQTYRIPTFRWTASPRIVLRFGGGGTGSSRTELRFQVEEDVTPPEIPRIPLRFFIPGGDTTIRVPLHFIVEEEAPESPVHELMFVPLEAIDDEACGQFSLILSFNALSSSASGASLTAVDNLIKLHIISDDTIRRLNMVTGNAPTLDAWSAPAPAGGKFLAWDDDTERHVIVNPTSRAVTYLEYDGTTDSSFSWSLHSSNADAVGAVVWNLKLYVPDQTGNKMFVYSLAAATRGQRLTADEFDFPSGLTVQTVATNREVWWLFTSTNVVAIPWGGGVRMRFREFSLLSDGGTPTGAVIFDDSFFIVAN